MSNYDYNSEYFVRSRPLGKKIGHLYMNVPWTDIAIQNTPRINTTNDIWGDYESDNNPKINTTTIINDTYTIYRDIPNDINIEEKYINDRNSKGEGKYYRERSVPSKKSKKYPTKNKTDTELDKKIERFNRYNYQNNYGLNIINDN